MQELRSIIYCGIPFKNNKTKKIKKCFARDQTPPNNEKICIYTCVCVCIDVYKNC